ncbi:DUF4352 domain-containing protein [Nocardia sp. AG03]|uniref:DUF4352 domain-containing protein n=1 Tax=Nocardia sp. AG03 TaxID=3025312 RepID=UPI0024183259|nr:DUF4352 domain-containing protein [Nocardia sp. AG03]
MTTPPYPPPSNPQPPYGPRPGYPPPPPRKSNSNVIILTIVGVFVLCGFGGCLALVAGSDSEDKVAATFTTAAPAAPAAPGASAPEPENDVAAAGSTVRDGKFEFTVTNIGNKAQSYWANNQKLIDDQGREFENDTMAGINVNEDSAMTSEINPGNSVQVVVVFDVPAGTTPAALELHDSAFSGGSKIALR